MKVSERYVLYVTEGRKVCEAFSAVCDVYNRIILSLNATVLQDSDRKTVADPGSLRGGLR